MDTFYFMTKRLRLFLFGRNRQLIHNRQNPTQTCKHADIATYILNQPWRRFSERKKRYLKKKHATKWVGLIPRFFTITATPSSYNLIYYNT